MTSSVRLEATQSGFLCFAVGALVTLSTRIWPIDVHDLLVIGLVGPIVLLVMRRRYSPEELGAINVAVRIGAALGLLIGVAAGVLVLDLI